jgi:hypothetical protein
MQWNPTQMKDKWMGIKKKKVGASKPTLFWMEKLMKLVYIDVDMIDLLQMLWFHFFLMCQCWTMEHQERMKLKHMH